MCNAGASVSMEISTSNSLPTLYSSSYMPCPAKNRRPFSSILNCPGIALIYFKFREKLNECLFQTGIALRQVRPYIYFLQLLQPGGIFYPAHLPQQIHLQHWSSKNL